MKILFLSAFLKEDEMCLFTHVCMCSCVFAVRLLQEDDARGRADSEPVPQLLGPEAQEESRGQHPGLATRTGAAQKGAQPVRHHPAEIQVRPGWRSGRE